MPTIQGGPDAFDHGFDVPVDYDNVFGTPTAVTDPLYQGRLNSLEINAPGNEGVRKNYSGGTTRAWVGFPIRFASFPTGGDTRVLTISAASDLAECFLYVNGSGQMYMNVGPNFSTSSSALSLDTFYWIEAIFDVSTTTYSGTWRISGSDQDDVDSGVLASASTCDYNQLLSFSGEGTMTWYAGGYWVWGSAASASDWLGEPSVEMGRRYKRLAGPAQLGTSAATLYTVPTGKVAQARRIYVNNPTAGGVGVTLSIGSDAAGTRLIADKTIAAGESLDLSEEHNLSAGEFIQAYADTASALVCMIDGIEESFFI